MCCVNTPAENSSPRASRQNYILVWNTAEQGRARKHRWRHKFMMASKIYKSQIRDLHIAHLRFTYRTWAISKSYLRFLNCICDLYIARLRLINCICNLHIAHSRFINCINRICDLHIAHLRFINRICYLHIAHLRFINCTFKTSCTY